MMPPNEQAIFFAMYADKRQVKLEEVIIKLQTKKKSTGSGKGKKIPVTVEQLELLKKLGLL
jgi:hypothetical protein